MVRVASDASRNGLKDQFVSNVKAAGPRARLGQDAPDHPLGRDQIGKLELDVHQLFTQVLGLPSEPGAALLMPRAPAVLLRHPRQTGASWENMAVAASLGNALASAVPHVAVACPAIIQNPSAGSTRASISACSTASRSCRPSIRAR
jgi:hypothetical protein